MDDLTTIVLIGVLGLVIGFMMGLLAGGGSDERAPKTDQDMDENWVDVARFWWDRRNNDLVMRAGERTYLKGAKVKDNERKRIQRILQELHLWLTQENIPTVEMDLPVATLSTVEPPSEQRSRNPFLTPVDTLVKALDTDVPKPPGQTMSIAAQVDEILQEMLLESPVKDRAIRLMEFPNKRLVVLIGLDQYDGIDAVPDDDIRDLIRAAVAEWEIRVAAEEE